MFEMQLPSLAKKWEITFIALQSSYRIEP